MNVSLDISLAALNDRIGRYQRVSGMAPAEALEKQGTKLGFELSNRLAPLAPAKGQIRAERLEALKRGEGVRVRESVQARVAQKLNLRVDPATGSVVFGRGKVPRQSAVRKGKRLNFQALAVAAELNLRERGRGYAAQVPRIGSLARLGSAMGAYAIGSQKQKFHRGRYNQLLASAGLSVGIDETSLTLTYGSPGTEAGEAVNTPRGRRAIQDSVETLGADIGVYLQRKYAEA